LNLDCNPILTLPDELENLKKLKHFSAKGKWFYPILKAFDSWNTAKFGIKHQLINQS
jgi:hypothetical protein